MTVYELKPVCSVHKKSIEQIRDGVAKWSCPVQSCKGKEIGYTNKLISEIWMRFWEDESELNNFQRSIGLYEMLFNTPSKILIDSIRKYKDIESIVEEVKVQQIESRKQEQKQLEEREAERQKVNLTSEFMQSMLKKSNTCSSCGIVPAFDGSCAC